jgi:AraC-like DNA-binding protein
MWLDDGVSRRVYCNSWIAADPAAQTGWAGALQDEQIGRALRYIHRDPARTWRVAAEAALSRSAFAVRFTELGDLASRLGYPSEAAFSRVFKRVIGVSPGAARRNGAAANDQHPGSIHRVP